MKNPALRFLEQDYFLREEKNQRLFHFTPGDQPAMQTRTDLFSIATYPDVANYAGLQAHKNEVLASYREPGAVVFNEKDALPAPGFAGECLFVAGKGGEGFTDASFARFTLASGIGYALIYTRSFYDSPGVARDSANALGEWINTQGSEVARSLLDFSIVLNAGVLRDWAQDVARQHAG